ncbi:hypothetical protein [Nonomuraea rubra]|uniref:Rpn family recombination-promoting nuclease/putative transposase n=1 Tax=Nonomuraea rubra TaxID=46180 RepID=A0A7X0U4Y8_9ACTN|nr:hypothetical protein [Nonomuraea rubra]MBB6555467.1 hypothetical protein [Nonomuraea rubra]
MTAFGNVFAMSPTLEHEYLIELVRNRPSLVTALLARVDVEVPAFDEALVGNCDFTDLPKEFRADSVVVLRRGGKPVASVILEVQRKYDPHKQWSWPVYMATLRAREKCPVMLLVFCQTEETAVTCASPIHMGHPGWVLRPSVAALRDVPRITDMEQARANPELAALSTIAHVSLGGDEALEVLRAWVEAEKQPLEGQRSYAALVYIMLCGPDAVQMFKELEVAVGIPDAMRNPIIREAVEYGEAKGEARGEAKAVLRILRRRDIPISHEAQERVLTCTDQATLETWIDRAITVKAADELFG